MKKWISFLGITIISLLLIGCEKNSEGKSEKFIEGLWILTGYAVFEDGDYENAKEYYKDEETYTLYFLKFENGEVSAFYRNPKLTPDAYYSDGYMYNCSMDDLELTAYKVPYTTNQDKDVWINGVKYVAKLSNNKMALTSDFEDYTIFERVLGLK